MRQWDWKATKAAKGSPPISHPFFADELILFAKANLDNYDTIMEVMQEFSDISGQAINFQKSNKFVSPNLSRNQARTLSISCGIDLTQDLGKYLGTPLIHKRVSSVNLNISLRNSNKKLSGWKMSNLSLGRRVTLIQSVTSAIPSYLMLTNELPIGICNEIKKVNRNFL